MNSNTDSPSPASSGQRHAALLEMLQWLKHQGYRFVTPTPATHARVVARPGRRVGRDLRDLLGWSLPLPRDEVPPELAALLDRAGAIEDEEGGRLRSRLRVSSLGDDLYLHSAYPTMAENAVFFGPDSYRFADLIARELGASPADAGAHIVDIGTGAGVGAIVAARFCPDARLTLTDINPDALELARVNAAAAGVRAHLLLGGDLDGVEGSIDVALANPPYIIDPAGRDYRDGGDLHGGGAARDMARMALARLAPGGRLILYTGSAIVDGQNPLATELEMAAREHGCALRCRELDPDVFGEELSRNAYADVERIAVIAAVFLREDQGLAHMKRA